MVHELRVIALFVKKFKEFVNRLVQCQIAVLGISYQYPLTLLIVLAMAFANIGVSNGANELYLIY